MATLLQKPKNTPKDYGVLLKGKWQLLVAIGAVGLLVFVIAVVGALGIYVVAASKFKPANQPQVIQPFVPPGNSQIPGKGSPTRVNLWGEDPEARAIQDAQKPKSDFLQGGNPSDFRPTGP